MVLASLIFLSCGLVGAVQGGALGTVRGVALATWIGALFWWWQLRLAMRESDILASVAAGPQQNAITTATLRAQYAAPVSARLRQSSNLRFTANDSDSIERQAGIVSTVVDASAPRVAGAMGAVSVGVVTADQPARVSVNAADDGGRIAAMSRGGPRSDGSDDRANSSADTVVAARATDRDDGDKTVIDEDRSAYSRYRTAFLALDAHDDLIGHEWEFDDSAGVDEQGRPPFAAGPIVTRLPYISAALRRRKWLWCAAALIGMLGGAAAYEAHPSAYQASTSILLTINPADNATSAMATEVALAQSRPVAELALSKLGLSQSQSLSSFLKAYTVTGTTDRLLIITVSASSSGEAVNEANALATEFLQFRTNLLQAQQQKVLAGLDQQISQAKQNIAAIGTQIDHISAQPASAAQQANLSTLKNQRSQAQAALDTLEQTTGTNQANMEVTTESMVRGSGVLNRAAPITHSRLKKALVSVVIGLIAGLVIGLVIVVVQALVSDRLRWRDDVAQALAAPVRVSVGTVRVRRWLPRGRRLGVARGRDVRRIVLYLRSVVYGRGVSCLALVSVDNEDVAAVTLVGLALSCAHEGKRVVVSDLSDGARAARLMGTSAPGIQTVVVDGDSLVVAVPDRDAIVPVGPLDRTPAPALPTASEELTAAYASADLMLTLVTLDPSLGTEHLATWASDAAVLVTAGRSSATRIHAVGELIRLGGLELISAVLVGADKSDESLGMTESPSQLASPNRNGGVAPDPEPPRPVQVRESTSNPAAR